MLTHVRLGLVTAGHIPLKCVLCFAVCCVAGDIAVNDTSAASAASQAAAGVPSSAPASRAVLDIEPFFSPPPEFRGRLGNYRSVLIFDDGRPVKTAADWQVRRQEILKYWHEVMGPWPEVIQHPAIQFLSKERVEGFARCKVRIEVAPGNVQVAYLLIPEGTGPFPAVLVTWYNAASSAGLGGRPGNNAFGCDLARRGFVTLCVGDTGNFTNRKQEYDGAVQPISYLAYCAANCANLLASLPQVDGDRIGIMGHSFGGKWAMFASCLYEKFACAVWCDPGIVWNEADSNANWWDAWYLGYEPGHKRKAGGLSPDNPRTGAYKRLVEEGRDLHELHALMAPRPFLVSGGAQDTIDHWVALNHTIAVNDLLGFKKRVAMTTRRGHEPTPESREQMYHFLEQFLK
jgi:hypothetical protein